MFFLRLLGSLALTDSNGEEVHSVLAQPKRLALLVYLGLAGPGCYVRRDLLLGIFWPESDEERARASFRQAVRFLRKHLGDDVIVNRGQEEVGLTDGLIEIDALEFCRHAKSGNYVEALRLYGGDFLDGFFVNGSPSFEDWLSVERARLRQLAAACAIEAAEHAAVQGDPGEAIQYARRSLALSQYDELVARRVMLVQQQCGDHAGAAITFRNFADEIERDLDVSPSAETESVLELLRAPTGDGTSSRTRQLQGPVEEVGVDLSLGDGLRGSVGRSASQAGRPGHARESKSSRHPRMALAVAGVGVALFGVMLLVSRAGGSGDVRSVQPVMVVPFDNSTGDPTLDPVGTMAADWITHGIAGTGAFEVVPSMAVLSTQRHQDSSLDDTAALRWLVSETRARSIVTGVYYAQRDSLIFHARITRARDGRLLNTIDPVAVPIDDLQSGVAAVQRRVLAAMAPLDETPTHARAASRPPSFEAYRAYVAGMEAFVRFDFDTALVHYTRASQADDSYAMPLLASAIALSNLGNLARADSIAAGLERRRADLGPFENQTLDFLQALLRGDDAAAYEAMLLNSRLAPGTIGHYQVAEQARKLNRPREALRVLRELGPERGELRGWIPYWRELTYSRHMLGHHRRELRAARRAREHYGDRPAVLWMEARALAALGRLDAIEQLIAVRLRDPQGDSPNPGTLMALAANELAFHGHNAKAEVLFSSALEWFEARIDSIESLPDPNHAQTLLMAGRTDEAALLYEKLEEALNDEPSIVGQAGVIAAARGDAQAALDRANRLSEMDLTYRRWVEPYWRAAIAAHLGDLDEATRQLQTAFGSGMQFGPWIAKDPNLSPLHGHAPFEDMVRVRG